MPEGPAPRLKRPVWVVPSVIVIAAALLLTHPGRALAHRLVASLRLSPFANVSIPAVTAVAYAGFYLCVILAAGVYHFRTRDL